MEPKNLDAAIDDLRTHTLPEIPGDFARLIYLSSTRDYNTGRYYHDGLALRFGEEIAGEALAICHREVFRRLALCPLEDFTEDMKNYVECSADGAAADLLRAWKKIEPYRVTVPLDADP